MIGEKRPPRRLEEGPQFSHPDVSPHEGVDPEEIQRTELYQHHQRQLRQHLVQLDLGDLELEAEVVGNNEGQSQHHQVEDVLNRPIQQPLPDSNPGRHV